VLKEIAERFNGDILAEAASRYGTHVRGLHQLEGFENHVYEFTADGQERILRLGHSLRRSAAATLGEIEWLTFLADGGVPVARAVPSLAGRWVEVIPDDSHLGDDGCFQAVAFERAAGVLLDDVPEAKARYWNEALFEEWGCVMGRLHARSCAYVPSDPALKRPEWFEVDVLDLDRFLPPDQTRLRALGEELLARLQSLPRSERNYGLIHADLTQWNFCVDEGRITLFDLDSSEYCWFVKDIAVALYYAPASHEGEGRDAFVETFLQCFLRGYRAAYDVDFDSLRLVPEFLMLQKLILYSFCHQLWDLEHLDGDQQRYLAEAKETIERRLPILNVSEELLRRVW
jgi:Ser/Thr protein kinase RdoA (MazF antagonist)